jgi:hypothetical protein
MTFATLTTRTAFPALLRALSGAAAVATWLGCGAESDQTLLVDSSPPAVPDPAGREPPPEGARLFPTSNVVFSDEGQSTYVSVLSSLARQSPNLDGALELAGWADLWVHERKVFVADGESPVLTRYSLDAAGSLVAEGRLSFQNYGATQAAFWNQLFVAADKAYWFNTEGREIVVWNPDALVTSHTFRLPELPDRGAVRLTGPSADRSSVVRGERAYVPFYWADWESYSLSEDSVIVVLDTVTDQIISVLSVPCPELNFATVDDTGAIYFSNWGYSALPTVLDGRARACVVRIPAGSDALDPNWSLTFAAVTGGREASALRWIGGGKALLTVFHAERAEIGPKVDRLALADAANWRLWMLDLATLDAAPIEQLGWHAFGLYGARIGGDTFLFVPTADYAFTAAYRFFFDGSVEQRWESRGWQTRLFEIER